MLNFIILALAGLTLSNPIDGPANLQPREDISNNHFDLCRILHCPRPTTTTTTVIVTSTATTTSVSTATVTATESCSTTSGSIKTTATSVPGTTTATPGSTTTSSTPSTIKTTSDSTTTASSSTPSTTTTTPGSTTSTFTSTDTTSTTTSDPATTTTPSTLITTTTPITTPSTLTQSTTTTTTTTTTSTPSPAATPLDCSIDAYFIQDRSLLRVNLKTGSKTTLSTTVGGTSAKVNAIGYNTLDNFIYGLQNKTLVRVSNDGSLQAVSKVDIAALVGDIDAHGQFYYSAGGNAWGQVDLKPGSSAYGTVVAKGVSDLSVLPKGMRAADWAYTPAAKGYLYSVAVDVQGVVFVMRWSVQTHRWEVSFKGLVNLGFKGSEFGAVVATSDGVLYASHNGSGQILRIPLANPNGASKSPLGPKASTNDGCRCASRPDVAT